MRKAIIVDIDGTLADITHRLHFVKRPNKDRYYPAFFDAMDADAPKDNIIEIIEELLTNFDLLLLTGRPEKYRSITAEWLERHAHFIWVKALRDNFFMRPDDDFTPDHELKARIYEEKIKGKFNVVAVFDDRQSVVDMWRAKGLTCFQVDQWEEFNEL